MLKKTCLLLLIIFCKETLGQSFLNGSFEFNIAGINQINITNSQYNNFMANSFAFGNFNGGGPNGGDMDIITSNAYCGLAQNGAWYVALTGSGTDAISLKLSTPLTSGQTYTISFYDRFCSGFSGAVKPFQIGLSTVNNNFGSVIYNAPNAIGTWTLRKFVFVAPNNGQFITVQINGGGASGTNSTWSQIDNFSFDTCAINLNLGNDTTLCQGQSLMLNAGSAASYLWSNSSTAPSINASTSGTYWVQSSNGQCSATDSITVSINQYPTPTLGIDTTLCQGQTITLNGGSASSYSWSNGSTAPSINASASGTYWVLASNGLCSASDSITISINQPPNPNLGKDTILCQGQTLMLNGGSAASYLWSNSSTAPSINASTSGTYWVQTSNGQCSATDSITISINQYPSPALGNDTSLCQGQTITLNGGSATSHLWSNGSTASSINASASGTYWVLASNGFCSASDSITISINQPLIPNLGNDTALCQGQILLLNAGSAASYLWSNGSTAPSINASTQGIYWVQTSNGQCLATDSITISINQPPVPNLGNDTTLCQSQTLLLNGGSATSYLWSNSSTAPSINVAASGTYWVLASNGLCSASDSITISINQLPTPNLGNDTTLSQGQTLILNGGSATSYLWSNGSSAPSLNASTSGTYWVQSSNGQCSATDSITVSINQYPTPTLGIDTTICQGHTITLNGGSASSYLWSNGSTAPSINAFAPGTYWVRASNGLCSAIDSIAITINQPPIPHLGNDTTLCQGQTLILNAGSATSYLWSNGSAAASINASTQGIYWVQTSNGKCTATDSITISINQYPIPNLGNDTTICQGQTIALKGGSATSYLWSNGSTAPSINALTTGIYWEKISNGQCSETDTITINFKDCNCFIYIPNAFTPDRNNINDNFSLKANCEYLDYNLIIYNRWGEKIFETSNSIESWDGTYHGELVPTGVYVFLVKYKFEKENLTTKSGIINLIR